MSLRLVAMRSKTAVLLLATLSLVLVACDSDPSTLSTTSSLVTGTTDLPSGDTTSTTEGPVNAGTTATTLVGETVTSYEVAVRIPSDNGEILYILVPEGAYTDVDLENFVGDLVDANPDLWGVEVFDDGEAVQAFSTPSDERTEDQKSLLSEHHFVSLIGGDTLRYRGPFSEFGEFIIGS